VATSWKIGLYSDVYSFKKRKNSLQGLPTSLVVGYGISENFHQPVRRLQRSAQPADTHNPITNCTYPTTIKNFLFYFFFTQELERAHVSFLKDV